MVGVLVISHGVLAETLISEAQCLIGTLPKVRGVSIRPKENQKEISNRIQARMAEVDQGEGIMILTDVLGGTPTNLSLRLLKDKSVQVVTGVNVPMLLALSSYRGRSLEEICRLVKKAGRRSIIMVKETLGMRGRGGRLTGSEYARRR
ncbi:MAG: PTS sugar transporter subunit IIA [Desulfobacteraceae bacterium]|nr:MAG: PTS sugar transporter subunit IIA [Desulfobacteraceae bacterium]